ncbi:MAG TPA: FumA C-terminus/TtdB family hydratase beta subunit [bacterium]|nr:FumA C-terminus/TtdB family hydratase beta subunit [bacterium]HOM27575.1 FumA C-terminus/TtdB family hydratase beta subunit [bacterium]
MKKIYFPLKNEKDLKKLKAGDYVLINGKILTARDAAHKKLIEIINLKKNIPIEIKNELIYYTGPSPTPEGKIVGSIGPTTSERMDNLTIPLLKLGLKGTMGKGERGKEIVKAFKRFKAVYFITYGGCGAYLSQFVKGIKLLAFEELGPEAIYQLEVYEFPAIVGIDIYGDNFFNYRKV